ncbi:MAG TPA: amidohydrolase family protein [Acidimicrobiales bacterium]|nr:amidohydrolase family protein [Acidimicrobiales bacterium]
MSEMATDVRGTLLSAPAGRRPTHGLLPDPEPQEVRWTVISADDHLVEPPDMFEGRLPASLADRAPRVVRLPEGDEAWVFDGQMFRQVGLNAVAGRPREDWSLQATSFDEMRRGCWDIEARVRDMDLAGVHASVNFPSQVTGFCGSVFAGCSDPALGLAVTRAWNDWMAEAWWGPYPDRSIPMGITWLADPAVGAAEIRRNTERGFTAVTLPEQPHRIGLPSVFTDHWDPILAACQDTGTVVCLHVGSSGLLPMPEEAPQLTMASTLFSSLSLLTCVEWLWSGIPLRFPELRIVLAEGGIGWVPMLLDRLDFMAGHSGAGEQPWPASAPRPSEVVRRSFWFCLLDDPSTLPAVEQIGVDHILFETDYPHADSLWPGVQDAVAALLGGLPDEHVQRITHRNAAELFRHRLPDGAGR